MIGIITKARIFRYTRPQRSRKSIPRNYSSHPLELLRQDLHDIRNECSCIQSHYLTSPRCHPHRRPGSRIKHLREIKDIVNNLHVQIPFVVKCYNGETSSAANAAPRFQAYSQFPELGSSIAVMENVPSFSLGPYVRLDNDNGLIYAVSTFHALLATEEPSSSTQLTNTNEPSPSKKDDNNPVSNRYSQNDPPIIIEQPSSSDHRKCHRGTEMGY